MSSKRTHDVVATIGKYKTRDGEEKKRYLNVGTAFTDDHGRVSILLTAVPTAGAEWSGWLSLYPIKDQNQRPTSQSKPTGDVPDDDDVPF